MKFSVVAGPRAVRSEKSDWIYPRPKPIRLMQPSVLSAKGHG